MVLGAASPRELAEVEEENNISTAHHTKIRSNKVTWNPNSAQRTEQDVLQVVSLLEKLNLKVTDNSRNSKHSTIPLVAAAVRTVEENRILVEGNR